MPCAGYVAVSIPLGFIALMMGVIGVLEFLRRKRTPDKNDDWGSVGHE
jgi:hypothetical protein